MPVLGNLSMITSSAFSKAIEQLKAIPQGLQWHVLEFIRVLTGLTVTDTSDQRLSFKGTYHQGTIKLAEIVDKRDGQAVIVTFLEEPLPASSPEEEFWSEFDTILNDCQIATGIHDFALQHDHYIHGTPKH
jgi:hypothetical protein